MQVLAAATGVALTPVDTLCAWLAHNQQQFDQLIDGFDEFGHEVAPALANSLSKAHFYQGTHGSDEDRTTRRGLS